MQQLLGQDGRYRPVRRIDAGGMGVGVGEWRPERDGYFGTFRVDPDQEVVIDK